MNQHSRFSKLKSPGCGRCAQRPLIAGTALLCTLVALLGGAPAVQAQVFPESPALLMSDGFEYVRSQNACWNFAGSEWEHWTADPYYTTQCGGNGMYDNWLYTDVTQFPDWADNGVWGSRNLTTWIHCPANSALLVARQSKPGHVDYYPADWTNVSIQADMKITQFFASGLVWGMTAQDDSLPYEQMKVPEDGYVFWIDNAQDDGYPGFR